MTYAGIILFKGNKILLQLRDNSPKISNPNKWGIFGGGVERSETPEQAAIRELKEELGLRVDKLDLFLQTEFNNEKIYLFRLKIKNVSNLRLNEGADMAFFSKEEILNLKNAVPGLKDMIKNFLIT
ncbi:NUDIX domain-containing protein [Candidatus Pacearchaeota archaeon]|nr:NUDIX domain-containing protein [Candidatus Pacearchaeota archaeon]